MRTRMNFPEPLGAWLGAIAGIGRALARGGIFDRARATGPSTPGATTMGAPAGAPHTRQTGSVPGATASMPAETGKSSHADFRK